MPEETRPRRSGSGGSARAARPQVTVRLAEGARRGTEGLAGAAQGFAAAAADNPRGTFEVDDGKAAELLLDRSVVQVPSLDLEELGLEVQINDEEIGQLFNERLDSVTRVFRTLDHLRKDLGELVPIVPQNLPPVIKGRLVNPDGSDAAYVSVRALEPPVDDTLTVRSSWPNPETRTDARGAFALHLPPRPLSDAGLTLLVTGSNRAVELGLRRIDLVGSGALGTLPLELAVEPLPRSVLAQLGDVLLPTGEDDPLEHPEVFASSAHPITLGEGDCARSFRSNSGAIDRFSYAMLVRLVAPSLSAKRLATRVTKGDRTFRMSAASATLSRYAETGQIIEALGALGDWELVERVPIEAPIDVSKFLQDVQVNPKAVPKAATLALGYTVKMHQLWIPMGMSLGDLVYSLPLAPGEQQRIAVSEERETLSVREQESLTEAEQQRYSEAANTSASAVFQSAFDESARGGSTMKTRTESGAFGGGLGVGGLFGPVVAGLGIGGGYSDSTTTGSSSSWQNASRDYVSNASEAFHSSLSRQAAARRDAARTSVRLATSTERREVVTKVITNHNHNHALTMQYWQVLRHFGVTSSVDDVQLVCFVPLELIQFLPPLMPLMLPTGSYPRNLLLYRYRELIRHHDVIAPRVARNAELRHGLRALKAFAGDPTMTADSSDAASQDIVDVSFRGTFLPFEDVYVTAVSTTGARIGPIKLTNTATPVATGQETRAGLIQVLRDRRAGTFETRTGAIALPASVPPSGLARFEFSRAFRPFSYRLTMPSGLSFSEVLAYLSNMSRLDVTLSPADLEAELGGPVVEDPGAKIGTEDVVEAYNGGGGTDLMPVVMPVAARRLAPQLSFADLLRIEGLLQHVVENTVAYSKAVWQSLTPEERAIMLEQYTIGVPTGGIGDASDEVPLLSCVANEVLGYYGNAALMPFFIPEPLAREVGFTSRDIQEALLTFHRQAYRPAQSSLTLPARGVLGEAVLGSCNSSEKIDLTRFWNWQDSPADEATDLASIASALAGGNQLVGTGGAQAPSQLQSGNSLVTLNQGNAAFTPPGLAGTLIGSQPATNLPQDLTGITELGAQMKVQTETTAETLNKTISEASGLAKSAMEALPHVVNAKAAAKKDEKKDEKAPAKPAGDGAADGGAAPTP